MADQVRRVLAFLEPVMSLQTREERFEKYQETWARLNPAAAKEVWKIDMPVHFPWSSGKVDLWRTLRREIEKRFQTALNEHLNGESTDRPIQPFSFMDYSEMLLELLDIYLKGLDAYIAIQDRISAVSANMHAYDEDERPMSEKSMHASGRRRGQDFLDVILFMHAVPQRATERWDALDHEYDVTWFRGHCKVYQENKELMAFLGDCAVVVVMAGCFDVPKDVKSIHDCYMESTNKFS
jgi:hypothetical protein